MQKALTSPAPVAPPTVRNLAWLVVTAGVIVLDQLTKHWIMTSFRPHESFGLTPFLSLVLAFNPGAAFSFLAGADGWQRWLFTAIAVVASLFMLWLIYRGGSRLFLLGLALIIGGALGNLWDRLTIGHVVDFILVHYRDNRFPAFNAADSAITVGAIALIVDAFFTRRRESAADGPRVDA